MTDPARAQDLLARWSHGFLWGADVYEVPRDASFLPQTTKVDKPNHLLVGGSNRGRPTGTR